MKKLLIVLGLSIAITAKLFAGSPPGEGMWLPMLIERLNYEDMQEMGLQLTAEELYSINNSSMKDAIVGLGEEGMGAPANYFCTGEIISEKGLVLTNHHCGYDKIQSHSSVANDYLTDGFWALSFSEELPNEGMTMSYLVRMEDVTSKVLSTVTDDMSESERSKIISKEIRSIEKEASDRGKYDVVVKDFFEGNEYYLFVYETYKDIRLVGAPPSSIGKFGGDTDNWMWPRHTGDFALFRIYTAPDGSPATYAEENIPLKPKHYLPISLKGVEKNDFAMIWGFPGTTDRFLSSYGIDLALKESNPTVVKIREKKLAILRADMDADDEVRIKYATKYAQTANYWKYFIGQSKGLRQLKVYERRKALEDEFTKWVGQKAEREKKYGEALQLIESGYKDLQKFNMSLKYLEEAVFQGPEFIYFSFGAFQLYGSLQAQDKAKRKDKSKMDEAIKLFAQAFKEEAEAFFKNFNKSTDKKLFATLMEMYYNDISKEQHPSIFEEVVEKKYKGDFNAWADDVYEDGIFVNKEALYAFLEKPSYKSLSKDPSWAITLSMIDAIRTVYGNIGDIESKINRGNRLFVDGLMEMMPEKTFYPNANSTLRMTYGKVLDYYPSDAVHYDYQTYLKGVMQKEDPSQDEFIVDPKLKALYQKKEYGPYGNADGTMTVCFLTDNDITGGNSGSPVINANGELIGVAFDGNWESMSGDIDYEHKYQRTISVDIRYVLFVIDKFAGAQNLIDEMTIVK